MLYSRSRPWRPRGPSFGSRAGARRRGHRSDEQANVGCVALQDDYLFASDVDISSHDSPLTADLDAAPSPHAARIDETGLLAFARGALEPVQPEPGAASGSWPLELITSERSNLIAAPPRRTA